TPASAGSVVYDVYLGTDSATIAARAAPPATRITRAFYVPESRWEPGSAPYWSITAINLDSGDTLTSPVWGFQVVPVGAAIDSVSIPANDWGYYQKSNRQTFCFESSVRTGSQYACRVGWTPASLGSRRLAGAYVSMSSTFTASPPASLS